MLNNGKMPLLQERRSTNQVRPMKTMRSLVRAARTFALVLAGWLAISGLLFAKDGETSEGGGGGSWVFAYFLTGLAVVLGMIVICRASTRRDRVRPEAYAEGKVGRGKE
jgi:hypothetical protein